MVRQSRRAARGRERIRCKAALDAGQAVAETGTSHAQCTLPTHRRGPGPLRQSPAYGEDRAEGRFGLSRHLERRVAALISAADDRICPTLRDCSRVRLPARCLGRAPTADALSCAPLPAREGRGSDGLSPSDSRPARVAASQRRSPARWAFQRRGVVEHRRTQLVSGLPVKAAFDGVGECVDSSSAEGRQDLRGEDRREVVVGPGRPQRPKSAGPTVPAAGSALQ